MTEERAPEPAGPTESGFPSCEWLAIERAEAEREQAVARYLRAGGWAYGLVEEVALCLWQRTLTDGRVVLCDEATALSVQQNIDALAFAPRDGNRNG